MNIQRTVHLTPPKISESHVKEKIICVRAHRERIFQVSTQILDDKVIFHNYGQGGAGWTFLFGCVNESLRQFDEHMENNPSLHNKPICVVGAGCYGLLTTIMLKRKKYDVHIVAQETADIASNKAAGFFFPRHRKSSTPQEIKTFQDFGMDSYATYQQIMHGAHPFITHGPKLLPAYYGLDIDPGFAQYIARGVMQPPEKVTINFGNDKIYNAMEYKTLFINSAAIMQELHRNITELGITITKKEIDTFNDIDEKIIFNCSGLGAKKLTDDKRMVPVQGHLITLKDQPPLDQLQYMVNVKVLQTSVKGTPRDELIYYAPKNQGILGITFMRGTDSTTSNTHEFDRILQRCQEFFGQ